MLMIVYMCVYIYIYIYIKTHTRDVYDIFYSQFSQNVSAAFALLQVYSNF